MARRQLPKVINGIDVTVLRPIEEVMQMFYDGKLPALVREGGYIPQADEETGMIRFVPWYDGHIQRRLEGRLRQVEWGYDELEAQNQEIERAHPIRRRTPQQRQAAMMVRLMGDAKRTGTIPGLSQEQLKTILGESWKMGEPLSSEDVQNVAAWFLGRAQTDNREADRHRVTRAHPTA